MAKPRIVIPENVQAGDTIEIKALFPHRMESGQRRDRMTGEIVPRSIVNKFSVTFDDQPVFQADMMPAISRNPFFIFNIKVEQSGTLKFTWRDDDGQIVRETRQLVIDN
ncbi:MAG: thiosulfate oxidation carrier complex protein SoxZ [Pseudomonadota bacterium]